MRESNYRKGIQIDKKIWYIAAGVGAAVLLGLIIFFFTYYRVENIEVMGSSHYSEEEIKEMVLRGPLASNSVLAPKLYTKDTTEDIPFVEGFSVKQINRNTIAVSVKEKHPVGCIPYLDSYIYFDRNGIFIEGSRIRDESVPYFDGIQVDHVVMNEKLPIKGTTILNTAVALSTIFQKNEMVPDHIQFDDNYQISLLYGDITVMLGKDSFLEDKMARVISILPKIQGKKGTLHAENITDSMKNITFEEYVEPVTAENWTGGYEEDGEYTGTGEYDEEGNHVGPKPEDSDGENAGEDGDGDSTDDSGYEDPYDYDYLYGYDSGYDYGGYNSGYDSYGYDSGYDYGYYYDSYSY